jgi:hypothetical protein
LTLSFCGDEELASIQRQGSCRTAQKSFALQTRGPATGTEKRVASPSAGRVVANRDRITGIDSDEQCRSGIAAPDPALADAPQAVRRVRGLAAIGRLAPEIAGRLPPIIRVMASAVPTE